MNQKRKEYIQKALAHFAAGGFLIVHDAEREEEGDIFLLSEYATAQKVNEMLHMCRGLFCVALGHQRFLDLGITLMCPENNSAFHTNFGQNIDAIEVKIKSGTGVTAAERALTLQKTAKEVVNPQDVIMPGHIATLQAQDPQKRFGHTEAAVELAKYVSKKDSVAISEILNDKGGKANLAELQAMSDEKGIPLLEIEEIRDLILQTN